MTNETQPHFPRGGSPLQTWNIMEPNQILGAICFWDYLDTRPFLRHKGTLTRMSLARCCLVIGHRLRIHLNANSLGRVCRAHSSQSPGKQMAFLAVDHFLLEDQQRKGEKGATEQLCIRNKWLSWYVLFTTRMSRAERRAEHPTRSESLTHLICRWIQT